MLDTPNLLNILPRIQFISMPKTSKIKKRAIKIGAKILTTEKDFVKISKKDRKSINLIKINLNIKNKKNFINFLKLKIYE